MLAPPDSGDHALGAAADALARRILERLPALQARSRDEIAALPGPVACVLLARLDARLDREATAPASDWIDPDRAGDAARAWREAARSAARVPAPAWAAFLVDACRLAVSHLVRPAETLAAVAFEEDGEAERPAALVVRRLGAFEPYPYLPDIAGRYVERKDIARLDRVGLESLLRRIDRRMVSTFTAGEWAGLLDPLVGLLGAPGVPGALAAAFFEAKGRDDLARAVAPAGVLTRADLHARLMAVLGSPAPALSVTVAEPAATDPEPEAPTDSEPTDSEPDGPEQPQVPDATVRLDDAPPAGGPAAPDWRDRDPDLAAWLTSASAEAPTPAVEVPPAEAPPSSVPRTEMPVTETDWLPVPDASTAEAWNAPHPTLPDARIESGPETSSAPPPPPERFDPPAAAPDEVEPLWKRMMASADRPDGPTPADAPAPADALDQPDEAAAKSEPLWRRFMPHPAVPSDAHLPRPPVAPPRPPLPDAPAAAGAPSMPPESAESTPETASEAPPETASEAPLEALLSGLDRLERAALGRPADDVRRALFVADLFGGDSAAYAETLAALARDADWTQASGTIARDIFRAHRVSPLSDAAVAFVDTVEARFRPL